MTRFYPSMLMSIFIGILLFSGCKKDEPEVIIYPITLTYDRVSDLTDWVAYENQNGTAAEVSHTVYSSNPDLSVPNNSDVLVSIKLISDSEAEITDDTETKTGTYIKVGTAFRFNIPDDTFGATLSIDGSGDENELTFKGRSYYEADDYGSIIVNGICVDVGTESLHCGEIDLTSFASSTSDGAVVVYRDFDIKFAAN